MSGGWAIVRTVGTDEEATLIRGFLESEGIPVEVESLLFHQEPVTFGRMGEVRVRVPADRVEAARRLLADREADLEAAPRLRAVDEPDSDPSGSST